MEELEALRELGLSGNEAVLYVELLRHGSVSAARLVKATNIHRATIYAELDSLIKKGLVGYIIKDYKRYYRAAPPEKLVEIVNYKKALLSNAMPKLMNLPGVKEPFRMEVHEGKSGVRTLFQDIVDCDAKEILGFGVTGHALKALKTVYPQFLKQFIRKGLVIRCLANHNARNALSALPKRCVNAKYLPREYAANVTTLIYGDRVSIQSVVDDRVYVLTIKDENLSNGYRKYFEYIWQKT